MKSLFKPLLATALGISSLAAAAQVTINVDAGNRGPAINDLHYGIFFEEINHAGDGGLYAELVKNRSFEDASSAVSWSAQGSATIKIVTDNQLNKAQKRAAEVTFGKSGDGIVNAGFWGMNIVSGNEYKLSLWAVLPSGNTKFTAKLLSSSGQVLGEAEITPTDKTNGSWTRCIASITATGDDAKGKLVIEADGPCTARFDVVSLFPPTYKGRENGCRPDLAQMLEDMNPAFMRFPGGCYVEGTFQNDLTNRFEWKNTIGPIEERPGHMNVNWNYRVSDGLGFHEMLQLSEDLGAEPLYVVNVGMGHGWCYNFQTEIQPFIQEALDAIEYCNGSIDTYYGAMRAAAGHPEPFNLRLLEVGNENANFNFSNNSDQSDHYHERYKAFYDAIKAVYPDMIIIGNVEAWGTDTPSWRSPYPVDALDEHYYRNPSWFESQYAKYDAYDRTGPKIYVGEYAVTSEFGNVGNLNAALGEAVYMLGMENNSDVVVMNSYAPIFVNENDQKWMPDMIRFSSAQSYGTPSYYVQSLMANNVGKTNVRWTESGNGLSASNSIGLSTWITSATFDNVRVTDDQGNVIFSDDFSTETGAWISNGGSWSVANGVLSQTDQSMEGAIYGCTTDIGDNYTFEVDATKLAGAEGFLIVFKYGDANNYAWWNLGGWSNTNHAIEVCKNGAKSNIIMTGGRLNNNQTYHAKVVVNGNKVKCYLDGELMFDVVLPITKKVYVSSTLDPDEGLLYVKMVNTSSNSHTVQLNVANATLTGGSSIVMSASTGNAENTSSNPYNVAPKEAEITGIQPNSVSVAVPAYSFTILKLNVKDVVLSSSGSPASGADIADAKAELKPSMDRVNFLHSSMSLPSGAAYARIAWELQETETGYIRLAQKGWTQQLEVDRLPDGEAVKAGTLVANLTFADGTVASISYDVTLAPEDEDYGYLYCFMNSGKEITNFALGAKEDLGLKFNVLHNGAEVFDTESLAGIEHGTRDAYLAKGERKDEYFMATTDMCNAKSGVWNNYGLDLLRSTDLIHWESSVFDFRKGKSIFSDPEATTDAYKTDAEYAKIMRVWAPQFIWDPSADAYLVYYSLLSTNAGDSYDKIYYSYADKDFKTLTQPRLFFDPGFGVIDGDIVYSPYDGLYHMYYKWEGANGGDRGIYEAVSDKLVGGQWKTILHITNEGSELSEGSSAVRRINEDFYNVYYMRYSGGSAYKVCVLDHAGLNPSKSFDLSGNGAFQHGSVITISEKEYVTLESWNLILPLIEEAKKAKAAGTDVFDEAIAQAENALTFTTVDDLSVELPRAIEALKKAKEAYVAELINHEGETDLTALLVNPNFANSNNGWQGTSIVVNNGVAEHYNKTFDTYQILENMPAGTYRFGCQGFYRAGARSVAHASFENGAESLNAVLYMNDEETPLMSLFSSDKYTYSPYNFPDNMAGANKAFNVDGQYTGNFVEIVLTETSDIKLGIKKTEQITSDWTCVDNFTFACLSSDGIIDAVAVPESDIVDVYNSLGVKVRSQLQKQNAATGLAPGIYMIGSKKVLVK